MTPTYATTLEQATTGLALLGTAVWYRIQGCELDHADLKARLEAADFGRHAPPPPSARLALRRAIEAWIDDRALKGQEARRASSGTEGAKERSRISVINSGETKEITFVLVLEGADFQQRALTHGTRVRIFLDKQTSELQCTATASGAPGDVDLADDILAELQPYWERYRTLLPTTEITSTVRHIITSFSSVALSPMAGPWFVPKDMTPQLDRLRALVDGLPGVCYVTGLGVPDTEAVKEEIARAVYDGLSTEIANMRSDLGTYKEIQREKTMLAKQAEYDQMQGKVLDYAGMLGFAPGPLLSDLTELRATVKELRTQLDRASLPRADARRGKDRDLGAASLDGTPTLTARQQRAMFTTPELPISALPNRRSTDAL